MQRTAPFVTSPRAAGWRTLRSVESAISRRDLSREEPGGCGGFWTAPAGQRRPQAARSAPARPGRRPRLRLVAPSGLRALIPHGGERLRLTPVRRCPGPASAERRGALGLRPLSPPGPAHRDRETSVIEKRTPEFRLRDRIQKGGDDGCGKEADHESGGLRLLIKWVVSD
jgi:hypothetical protein